MSGALCNCKKHLAQIRAKLKGVYRCILTWGQITACTQATVMPRRHHLDSLGSTIGCDDFFADLFYLMPLRYFERLGIW